MPGGFTYVRKGQIRRSLAAPYWARSGACMRNGAYIKEVIPATAALLMSLVVMGYGAPVDRPAGQPRALVTVVKDPAALVAPFVGTGRGGQTEGGSNAFPGATVPFGMIQWSPDTPSRPPGGGYYYGDSRITGFSLTHVSGPGCAIGGAIPILPVAGALPAGLSTASEPFRHSSETAH